MTSKANAFTALLTILAALCPIASAGEPAPQKRPLDELVAALSDPGDRGNAAIESLKRFGPDALPALEKAASAQGADRAAKLRALALMAYHEFKGPEQGMEIAYLLRVASWDLPKEAPAFLSLQKSSAREALDAAGPESFEYLLSTFPGQDYGAYSTARDVLVKKGAAALPGAAKLLSHDDFIARLRAVHLMALIGGDDAMELVASAAQDRDVNVRRRVLEAFAAAGGKWSGKTAGFLEDKDAGVRVAAVRGCGVGPGLPAGIGARLSDDSFTVRMATAEVLAAAGEKGFEAILAAAGGAGAGLSRVEAVRALGLVASADPANAAANAASIEAWRARIGTAADALKALLKDEDWAVRAAAVRAIGSAGRPADFAEAILRERHPFVLFRAAEAAGDLRPPALDESRLSEEGRKPQSEGFDALGFSQDDEAAVSDLLKALNLSKKDLEFDRNYSRDEFRFPIVQKALDEPLSVPSITREVAARIRSSAKSDPCSLFAAMASIQGGAPVRFDTGQFAFADAIAALHESGLPEALKKPLSAFLAGAGYVTALEAAFSKLTVEDRERILSHTTDLGFDTDLLPVWKKVDRAALGSAAAGFSSAVVRLADAIVAAGLPPAAEGVLWECDTTAGKIRVCGRGADRHTEPHFLLVDLGGDDLYIERAAAGALGTSSAPALCAVIDADGNDRYVAAMPVSQGAGYFGVGVLVDSSGSDSYKALVNSQGLGWFGAGLLLDCGGDDRYDCDSVCQGAAGFGFGALVDQTGDDIYYARAYSQGFGFTGAVGLLADADGNDLYYADGKYLQYESMPHRKLSMSQGMGYGMRPHASGGIGILWEGGGDDVYRGNAFAQASSYWFALGVLVDESGFDNYSATIYSQSSGIHMGIGALADLGGDDNYTSWGLSQSGSHDMGVSWFLDAAGNDMYTCHDASLGGAINHAVALFIDRAGRDAYFMKNRMAVGSGDKQGRRDMQSIGLFIDLGGAEDTYPQQKGGNGRFWADGTLGAGLDR